MTETFENLNEIEAIIKGHLDFKERYSDLRAIGIGGMGAVFQVKDNKLDKLVAVKVLHGNSDPKLVVRFQQEARALSLLNHKYIVSVLDFQSSERNELFLIMEYVDGINLDQFVQKHGGPLPLEDVVTFAIQLCEALRHAHSHGVIHRDLKPSNIMIDLQNNVRILDFGIAKLLSQENQFGTMTRAGVPLGTPAYMSPEQVRGDATDERTDVFGLGLLIYIMAAGRSPFDSDQVLEYYKNLLGQTPPSLRLWIGESDAAHTLDQIVATAMKSDPNERFQNMTEMHSALTSLVADPEEILQVSHGITEKSGSSLKWVLIPVLVAGLVGLSALVMNAQKPSDTAGTTRAIESSATKNPDPHSQPNSSNLKTPVNFIRKETEAKDMRVFIFATPKVRKSDFTGLDPSIEEVSLEGLKIDPDMVDTLATLEVTALDLSGTNITDLDMKKIAKMKKLQWLRLDKTGITTSGIRNLSPLNQRLRRLDLDSCININDQSIKCLIESLPNLRMLHIGDTSVTGQGVRSIAKLTRLTSLWLNSLPITDEDVRALSHLDLILLHITNSQVTDETLKILMPQKRLEYLDLTQCPRISDDAASEFIRAHRHIDMKRETKRNVMPISEDLYHEPPDIK